jgi:hypothetical protein
MSDKNMSKAKIAALVESSHDPEVDAYIPIIVHQLNRDGYKYITTAWEHGVPRDAKGGRLALVIVLDVGYDEEELRKKDLGDVDWSIEWARPHVLVGPDVWESYE